MSEVARGPSGSQRQAPLLATKLRIPKVRQSLVKRPHLVERLNICLEHKLTLVSAPAGFGKTTLVSTWACGGIKEPIVWLSLDDSDNDTTRFLNYLVAALQKVDPAIGEHIPGTLQTAQSPPVETLIGALVNDLVALSADFVLVLDDYHVIHEATIHEAIQILVAHGPAHMHLLVVTREDPPLPLGRLRAGGDLLELRAQDLRFSAAEVSVFLRDVMGLVLEPHEIYELNARIEGWVAGLQLAALSMQNREHPAELIASLSGSHHFILGYLTEEVLHRLPPEVQSFLLETAVLDRLTGPLCDAVTGLAHGNAMLEQLYRSNVFVIPMDEEHRWYRYHQLFAELLRSQLNRTQPNLVPALHRRASEWYESQESPVDAIEHALAAGDYQHAVRLLEKHARPVTLQGYAQTVESWLRRLPQEWRAAGPRANLAFGWSLLLRGQLGEIESLAQNAEAAAAESTRAGAHVKAAGILAEATALRATMLSIRGDTEEGTMLALKAVALAPLDDLYLQGITHFALASAFIYAGNVVQATEAYREALPLCQASGNTAASMLTVANLALLHIVQGQLRAAADICRTALSPGGQSPDVRSPTLATVYCNFAEVLYEWGELAAARRMVEQGLELSKRGGHVTAVAYGNLLISRLMQAEGDLSGAGAALDEAVQTLRLGVPDWVGPRLIAQQVTLALALADEAAASWALAGSGVHLEDPVSEKTELLHITYLRQLLHQGRLAPQTSYLDQGLDLAGRLLALAEQSARTGRAIEISVLRALLYHAQGETRRGLEDLGRALALGEPEGYLRLFLDEGAPMAHLLKAALEQGIQAAYVTRLLDAFPDQPVTTLPLSEELVDPLTERELEVLRLMAKGLTYEEVAQQLVVSLNTVRFHVRGIYGKLGADRRAIAVQRARDLKLL